MTLATTYKSDAELDIFLNTDEFAQSITIGGSTVNAIVENGLDEQTDPRTPRVICKESDLASVSHYATVTIATVNYSFVGYHPDGEGIAELILQGSQQSE